MEKFFETVTLFLNFTKIKINNVVPIPCAHSMFYVDMTDFAIFTVKCTYKKH